MSSFLGWYGLPGSGKIISVFDVEDVSELENPLHFDTSNLIRLSDLYSRFSDKEIVLPSNLSINTNGEYTPSSDGTIYSVCDAVYTIKGRPWLGFTHGYYSYTRYAGKKDKATGFLSYIGGFSSDIHSLNHTFHASFNSKIYEALLNPTAYYVALIARKDKVQYGNIYFALLDAAGNLLTSIQIAAYPEYIFLEDLTLHQDKSSARNDSLPTSNTVTINLYRNDSEKNVIGKYLISVRILNGTFKQEADITNLSIQVDLSTVPNFNYLRVPLFNRYYFVDNIVNIRDDLWEISCHVDVLESFKDTIMSTYGLIERNEFEFNPKIIDHLRVIEQGVTTEVLTGGMTLETVLNAGVPQTMTETSPRFMLVGTFMSLEGEIT